MVLGRRIGGTVTTITLPFELGEKYWVAEQVQARNHEVCPECVGTKKVTLTLGNGESYEIPCAACSAGYEPPTGVVRNPITTFVAVPFVARRFHMDHDGKWTYSDSPPDAMSYRMWSEDRIFRTEAEAEVECQHLHVAHMRHMEAQYINQFSMRKKSYATSVHYWRGQRRDYEKKLAWIDAKLVQLKGKP
jgi:hypothetical protein